MRQGKKKEQNTESFQSWEMFNAAADSSTPIGLFLSVFPICPFCVSLNITFFTDTAVLLLI